MIPVKIGVKGAVNMCKSEVCSSMVSVGEVGGVGTRGGLRETDTWCV